MSVAKYRRVYALSCSREGMLSSRVTLGSLDTSLKSPLPRGDDVWSRSYSVMTRRMCSGGDGCKRVDEMSSGRRHGGRSPLPHELGQARNVLSGGAQQLVDGGTRPTSLSLQGGIEGLQCVSSHRVR